MPTITTHYLGDMLFASTCGTHHVHIDVPPAMGGSNRGPKPPELFVASLGSCIAAFVAHYCQHHEIDARGMTVDVSFEKAEKPGRLVNLAARVNLPCGDFAGREQALQRVAEQCIIHETLANFAGLTIDIVSEPAADNAEEEAAPLVAYV